MTPSVAIEADTDTSEVIRQREYDADIASTLHNQALIGRILAARGVTQPQELDLTLKALIQPQTLMDFNLAVDLLCDAVQQQQRILIVGDYDADGATSTALASHVLRAVGASVDYLVPNRFEYGYGLSPAIVEVALQRSPDLLLTVDNGIASIEGVKLARSHGVKVVVTDHHLPPEVLPEADAIVNPNRSDCTFPGKCICGVGVIFYVMVGVCRKLQESGYLSREQIPQMADYLDLVALGTVADVVPLDRNNRISVSYTHLTLPTICSV